MSQHNPTNKEPDDPAREEPVVLVGEPKSLRGELRWNNTYDEKVVLREALLKAAPTSGVATDAAASQIAASDAQPLSITLSATIPPRQSQRVPLTLDLGRHTPPGEYRGELNVGGSTRPLIMHVVESARLRVSPAQVVIDDRAGATVRKRVVLSNEGNVPLTIGKLGHIILGEEMMLSLGLRATIATVNNKTRELENLFAEIVRDDAGAIMRQVGSLEVSNPDAPVVLQPGDVRPLDLEIRLPDNLAANSRYRGRLPLYTTELEFVIVPVTESLKRKTTNKP